ncbi:uncharacterized protein PV07_09790 [Cladophialophora immunda]|uniref:Cyclin-like domain-containing protein n=1 Tax=Cladophialophora immunda TaxID=569365 RepID=A0A0D2BY89_9EURO|nr:uncharacterized protein PV07_09790 [Cladophialophora immunda]KIW24053.1 hypothetical protein PV07_09790 [Cladophialophora immunda]
MILDDAYRGSTQYRLWSYTEQHLAQTRQNTNALASKCLREKSSEVRATGSSSTASDEGSVPHRREDIIDTDVAVQTLTVEEETKIVEWGCMKILEAGEAMDPRIPSEITATAIQYLRRFYLTNSPMIHHPKSMVLCALYLATKADHFYFPLSRFVGGFEGVSAESVKGSEFVLLQGLRFALDVRHPMKGLAGGRIEMQTMADEGQLGGISNATGSATARIDSAADQAKRLLATAAQMTDAYFLYTPSQMWLAAMMVADRDLVETYLGRKLAGLASPGAAAELGTKLVPTISACAQLLASYHPSDAQAHRKELSRIRKKLDTLVVPRAKSGTREGEGEDSRERPVKRRKLGAEV